MLQKSAACENVNNRSVCAGFTNVYMSSCCAHALVSRPYPWRGLVFPSSPLISVSPQREPPLHPPHTCTGSRPGASQRGKERKRKSIISLSLNCQCGQQPVNHRSRAMADLPEHRSGKIFIKLITARLVIALFQRRAGERSERLEFICGLLVSCHICCRCCKRSLFS